MNERSLILATTVSAVALVTISAPGIPVAERPTFARLPKFLLWNTSASAPRGLYLLHTATSLQRNDLVVVTLPSPLARFASERGYLPIGVPLLKHIAALPGQAVCRTGTWIRIDGQIIAQAANRDRLGRTLPVWSGCRRLEKNEFFLLNPDVRSSFDGRYFGVTSVHAVSARAIPLWVEPATALPAARTAGAAAAVPPKTRLGIQSQEGMPEHRPTAPNTPALAMPCSAHCAASRTALPPSAASGPASTHPSASYDGFVREAARRFAIPASVITAVIRAESNGDANAVSSKGAMGLMQIMPSTWSDLQPRYRLGADPFDPHDNILAGAGYLRELFDRFGPDRFLAAYHAGPSRLEVILDGRTALGPDTQDYLRRLGQLQLRSAGWMVPRALAVTSWRTASLFLTKPAHSPDAPDQQSTGTSFPLTPQSGGLFVAPRAKDQP